MTCSMIVRQYDFSAEEIGEAVLDAMARDLTFKVSQAPITPTNLCVVSADGDDQGVAEWANRHFLNGEATGTFDEITAALEAAGCEVV